MSLKIEALDHLVLNVTDPEVSANWYQEVLGMTRAETTSSQGESPRISVKFGAQMLNLRPVAASKAEWFTADHEGAGSDDLCFLTQSRPEAVTAHLQAHGVRIEEGPVEKRGARGTLISIYCRDPDGSLIEISSYID
jgi:catechol 2,3-dioxygenase-like lactoylglutathione lyase family enzyme